MPVKRKDKDGANMVFDALAKAAGGLGREDEPPEVEATPAPAAVVQAPAPAKPSSRKTTPKRPAPPPKAASVATETKPKVKTVAFTPGEVAGNEEVIRQISEVLGCKIPESTISRAMWEVLRQSKPAIARSASTAQTLRRPPTGDPLALADFENEVVEYLASVLKRGGQRP